MKILSNKKVLLVLLALLFSIPIFNFNVYLFLVDKIGIGFAYSIDQFLPLIIAIIGALLIARKNLSEVKQYIITNRLPILIIIVTSLVVHGWVLGNYFFGEEPNSILRPVNVGEVKTPLDLRGWHLGMYILSYELFHTNVLFYNILALALYIFTALILYIFLTQIFNGRIMPALIGVLFFVTTPSYMDMFFWQLHLAGMPIALSAGLLCLIFLFLFQKNGKFLYYFLSLMFYLSMLKISFTRFHGFIALPLFMCLFPLLHSPKFYITNIKKFALVSIPFICILSIYLIVVFIIPDHGLIKLFPTLFPNSEYAGENIIIARKAISAEGYLPILSLLIAYLVIPSQLAQDYYPKIREFLKEFPFLPQDISLTYFFGVLIMIIFLSLGLLALKNIRQVWGRLMVFSLVALFANLVFIPLLIQGYSDVGALDQRISQTGPGSGPGIRYVFASSFGLSIFIAATYYWISKNKKYFYIFLSLVIILFVYYSHLSVLGHTEGLKNIHPAQSAVPNSIFRMVPRDGQKKLLYSVNPEKNTIDRNIGDWLYAFYKPDELLYTKSYEDVKKKVSSGMYEKSNFYAFYNNTHTQTFKDVSELARSEIFDNKLSQDIDQLIQDADLHTSFTKTNNSTFPYVLKRGIYISEDFNQQILSPRKLSISVHKSMLPIQFPYVDGFVAIKDYQDAFPRSIWDRLNNRPLNFTIKQMNLAFSVKFLNNGLINQVPYRTRLNIARESIKKTDKEISDLEKVNKHYIDSQEILSIFLDSLSFNSLGLVYACAEDEDFEKQNKSQEMIGGVWYVKEFPLHKNMENEELSTSITCFGSKLRQIILIGPPIPSNITASISLSND